MKLLEEQKFSRPRKQKLRMCRQLANSKEKATSALLVFLIISYCLFKTFKDSVPYKNFKMCRKFKQKADKKFFKKTFF